MRGWDPVSSRAVREGFTEEATFQQKLQGDKRVKSDSLGKSIPVRGNERQIQSSEGGTGQLCL